MVLQYSTEPPHQSFDSSSDLELLREILDILFKYTGTPLETGSGMLCSLYLAADIYWRCMEDFQAAFDSIEALFKIVERHKILNRVGPVIAQALE